MLNTPIGFLLISLLCAGISLQSASRSPIADTSPYSLRISTQQETVTAGNEVQVAILLTNISNDDINVTREKSENRGEYIYDITVRDKSGVPANKTRYLRAATGEDALTVVVSSQFVVKMKPGETIKNEIVLNRLFDLSMPGEYLVQVSRNKAHKITAGEGKHHNDSSSIKSNVLKIRIVE